VIPRPKHLGGRFLSGNSRGMAGLENSLLRTDGVVGESSDRASLRESGVEGIGVGCSCGPFPRGKASDVDFFDLTSTSRATLSLNPRSR
jgi:hypothetical protein